MSAYMTARCVPNRAVETVLDVQERAVATARHLSSIHSERRGVPFMGHVLRMGHDSLASPGQKS